MIVSVLSLIMTTGRVVIPPAALTRETTRISRITGTVAPHSLSVVMNNLILNVLITLLATLNSHATSRKSSSFCEYDNPNGFSVISIRSYLIYS